ncbi:MAG: glutamate--tRNA ligase family protein [Gemmatimonadaceae bacterium]
MSQSDWRHTLGAQLPTHHWRTRFAPAPTGHLHLGHVVNALYVWGIARAYGGAVVLRLEDHDRTRCRPEYEEALLEDLDWLGFVPDISSTASFRADREAHAMRQSNHGARYLDALQTLEPHGRVYPCDCSRRRIAAASDGTLGTADATDDGAPVLSDASEALRYPGWCAHASRSPDSTPARRVRMAPGTETFADLRLGRITQEPAAQCGDLLVRDRLGQWTYQFAVVVDDLAHEIDVIIRGEDLLASTGRQLRLRRLLGGTATLHTVHHPLVRRPDGTKLSKANHDTAIRDWRARGMSAAEVIGAAAHAVGLQPTAAPRNASAVAALFHVASAPS